MTELKTVEETAAELNVSSRTVRRYFKSGKLEYFTMGARLKVTTPEQRLRLIATLAKTVGKPHIKKATN